MRRGKEAAQVAHASMAVFFNRMSFSYRNELKYINYDEFTEPMLQWMNDSFTKVVVGVETEEEIYELKRLADEAEIVNAIIKDNGLTEFKGKRTTTALAIGPDYSDKIDKITGHLKLR